MHKSNLPHLDETVQMCIFLCFLTERLLVKYEKKEKESGILRLFGQLHSVLVLVLEDLQNRCLSCFEPSCSLKSQWLG